MVRRQQRKLRTGDKLYTLRKGGTTLTNVRESNLKEQLSYGYEIVDCVEYVEEKKKRFIVIDKNKAAIIDSIPDYELDRYLKMGYQVVEEKVLPGEELQPQQQQEEPELSEPVKAKPAKKSKYEGLQDGPLHTEYLK